ncbi:MAG: sugar (Glycoside-Pentoside-Hexuronide) transporter [Proteobacteria bacterium]|nr:sugar (Glycoside-Pentoside-Hexuronide) transporter [Pseudomonadota bacterium]
MNTSKPLHWTNVLGYGVGDVANNFAFAMGALFLLHYYIDVVGIPAAAAGTMLTVVRIYDAVMDLVAGRVIDRTSTHWGRFRPFLLWGAVPLMFLSVAVFSVPSSWGADAKLMYAYVSYALLGTAYSFINIPYGALATVMTQVPRERALLGASRTLMAVCTFSLLSMTLGPVASSLKGPALQTYLTQFTLILAVVGVMLYLICFKSTREIVQRAAEPPKLKDSLATLLKNRPLLMLCASAFCMLLGYASSGASLVYFARYELEDARQFFMVVGIVTLSVALISAPIVPMLVGYIGKKHTFLLGLAVSILGYSLLYFASGGDKAWIYASFSMASFGVRIAMAIMWALEADTVEYGEWCTGLRIEGLTYSFFSFTRKCGQSLGGSIPAFLLAASGYIPNALGMNEAARESILRAVAIVPALAFLTAFVIMLLYPLTDQRFAELVRDIKKRRQVSACNVE